MTTQAHTISWAAYTAELSRCSALLEVNGNNQQLTVAQGFECLLRMLLRAKQNEATVYFAGNGASAAMSSHTAADLAKNGGIRTRTFSDAAYLTCISNDIAYEQVFASALELHGRPGDIFVGISSSGMSPNIVAAARSAQRTGLETVTLTGFTPQNTLRGLGTLNFYVPSPSYGMVESVHAAILHYGVELFLENTTAGSNPTV